MQKVCNIYMTLYINIFILLSVPFVSGLCFASLNHFVLFYPITLFAVSISFFFSLLDFLFLLSLNLYHLYGILLCVCVLVASVQFSRSVTSDSLRPHELQHARLPCPSPTPRAHSHSYPWSRECHPAISSSVVPFPSCPQTLPASESFPMSQLFA